MKTEKKQIALILSGIVFLVLFYLVAHVIYIEYLKYANQKAYVVGSQKPTKNDFKNIEYRRLHILCCDGQIVDFEKMYFSNDTTLVIQKTTYAIDKTLLLKKMFGPKYKTEEKYILKNDTLFSQNPIILAGTKVTRFFTFKFEEDSVKIGKYDEIQERVF